MNSSWIDILRKKLEGPLPGEEAHRKMMSYKRKTAEQVRADRSQAREGAVLFLIYPKDNAWHTVLIQRPVYEGTHSGQVAFPGGKRDPEDSDLHHTALRETEEEVGLDPDRIEILGDLSEVFIPPSNFLVQPVIGLLNSSPHFIPEPREVGEILETPVNWFFDPTIIRNKDIFIPHYNITINAPYYHVHDRTLWGATAMMISEFTQIMANDWKP